MTTFDPATSLGFVINTDIDGKGMIVFTVFGGGEEKVPKECHEAGGGGC